MNKEIYLRLERLMKNLGFIMQDGSAEKAEVMGYAAAISLADNALSEILDNLFIDTMGQKGISMYSQLLDIKNAGNESAAKQKIVSRISENYHQLTLDEFKSGVSSSGSISGFVIEPGQVILQLDSLSKESMEDISYVIKNYFPVNIKLSADGNGLSWDSLDAMRLRWYEAEDYSCSFDFWETLKGNAVQQ